MKMQPAEQTYFTQAIAARRPHGGSPRGGSSRSVTARIVRAFTLVEILIVVVILGILATIVIPQFSNASHEARENTLKDDLRFLRLQAQVYKAQHRDAPPGYANADQSAAPTSEDFMDQMTKFSTEAGAVSTMRSQSFQYGPYLSRMPNNPLNDQTTIYVIGNGQAMPGIASLPIMNGPSPYGWIYKPQTQEWMANLEGSDTSGIAYSSY